MVVLEAAAIGAVGYGAYRGGEAAVQKGKDTHKDMVFQSKRREERGQLAAKKQGRVSRIAELAQQRQAVSARTASTNTSSSSTSAWPLSSSATNVTNKAAATTPSGSVDDRHRDVMAKLRAGRQQEAAKSKKKNPLGRFFGKK